MLQQIETRPDVQRLDVALTRWFLFSNMTNVLGFATVISLDSERLARRHAHRADHKAAMLKYHSGRDWFKDV
jgi:hypothetical protein